jgi:alcohol dehydrogenase (cytochrome c)
MSAPGQLLLGFVSVYISFAQVSPARLLKSDVEPQNWLTYSGTYHSQRYSKLDEINPRNAHNLRLKWVFQSQSLEKFEATPLVVDGVMYVTQPPNDVVALSADTGRVFWIYNYKPRGGRPCCGQVNRGLAILGDMLYMATTDAKLVALDARNGRPLWITTVADASLSYSMTVAPLAVNNSIIVGVAGAELGIRGFIAAYDALSGKEVWRFYTAAGPEDRGGKTWRGDDWTHGGGSIWVTGSYDPELNLTYWGTGNPAPPWNSAQRPGDNLYTDSVVALDADTGKLKWHFQFTPGDPYDWDATQIPVLVDADWRGSPRKLMLWANRNGFFYVLDRETGMFLLGRPFVKVNWASGLDDKGRPIATPQPSGSPTFPCIAGGTNWYSPSYSPRTRLFYVPVWENCSAIFSSVFAEYRPGQFFGGGVIQSPVAGVDNPGMTWPGPINTYTEELVQGAIAAIDPQTGLRKWEYKLHDVIRSGILTTASDVLFAGSREGHFHALDSRTGALLWRTNLGGDIVMGPMTYAAAGRQFVAVAAGNSLFAFALGD